MAFNAVIMFRGRRSEATVEIMLSRLLASSRIDPFLLMILTTVAIAAVLPSHGAALTFFSWASKVAIGLLFFLYGARLSSSEILHGVRHWRLQGFILATTFVAFPLLGLAFKGFVPALLGQPLYLGVLYLCVLPSTVQSAIALVSVARGNIPAAVVAASASSLLGIFITPVLVGVLMSTQGGGFNGSAVGEIFVMLLLPFLAGQVLRRWIGRWVKEHGKPLKVVDRGSILLVVYVAFSKGMNEGIWSSLSVGRLLLLALVCLLLLGIVFGLTWAISQRSGFSREDSVTILFCGSTKSLATGLPMATVLFADQPVGLIVLPLMLYHQFQLLIGAMIATRLDKRAPEPAAVAA
jgi:sodium/bile acid cotransporter 7